MRAFHNRQVAPIEGRPSVLHSWGFFCFLQETEEDKQPVLYATWPKKNRLSDLQVREVKKCQYFIHGFPCAATSSTHMNPRNDGTMPCSSIVPDPRTRTPSPSVCRGGRQCDTGAGSWAHCAVPGHLDRRDLEDLLTWSMGNHQWYLMMGVSWDWTLQTGD